MNQSCLSYFLYNSFTVYALISSQHLISPSNPLRQALSVDELCLRTTSRSLETVADRSSYLRSCLRPSSRNLPPSSPRRRPGGAQSARHEVAAQESFRHWAETARWKRGWVGFLPCFGVFWTSTSAVFVGDDHNPFFLLGDVQVGHLPTPLWSWKSG
jgi:hypothetical protein